MKPKKGAKSTKIKNGIGKRALFLKQICILGKLQSLLP